MDKNKFQAIFLYEYKLGKTASEMARNVNEAFGEGSVPVLVFLREIRKKKKMDKWVPHELTRGLKKLCYEFCSTLLLRHENDPFLKHIVAYDLKWILYNNTKWLDTNEAPKHFSKPDFHQKKCIVKVWWTAKGIVHYSILKPGETITALKYYQ